MVGLSFLLEEFEESTTKTLRGFETELETMLTELW